VRRPPDPEDGCVTLASLTHAGRGTKWSQRHPDTSKRCDAAADLPVQPYLGLLDQICATPPWGAGERGGVDLGGVEILYDGGEAKGEVRLDVIPTAMLGELTVSTLAGGWAGSGGGGEHEYRRIHRRQRLLGLRAMREQANVETRCGRCEWWQLRPTSGEPQPTAQQLEGVSGRVRLARSDADRVLGTGADCPRASDEVRCVLPVVRQTLRWLTNRWNGRHPGRGVVSTGPGAFRVGFPRLVAGRWD
jgi:hypothetical protein